MARNEEKAQSMLNRFLAAKEEEKRPPKKRRPYLASQCRDLAQADRWRIDVIREIGKKVMDIQNPGIDEHRLREMNDEINKLIREKWHWEVRIVELGGQDHRKFAPKITDEDGNEAPEIAMPTGRGPGYRYFGAAKNLPGVKELFDKPKESKKKRSRHDMFKCIDADYYGYRDEEDGMLVEVERVAEARMREEELRKWHRVEAVKSEAKKSIKSGNVVVVKSVPVLLEGEAAVAEDGGGVAAAGVAAVDGREFVAHVPVPDNEEIARLLLEKKKKDLLSKYASEDILEEQSEAKEMLNIKR
ncbi:hypothetical protein SELMODRAFT_423378 [Selaginella moellendorffii]|uniref:Uncharacterized protein n=1 Tax=Selaginella moellendorffii TaxID=88036 RepID=D8SLI1_SELML|nr:pre-mRNA-splicing factor ISY1 homolog [Selaginella moellendorffii]XP_024533057.1 pre-mRNA-splicing factor ISY1 homolog [Selaginella moellendorffii]EFJ14773.1 hypothetical protein SELMODRAFT_423378 [Selaginella moellendorffii]|eukprot:XP_002984263.1 pre-mRNA-splicing factor ISY1 homolog [Selaginella moellendorffii]